MTSTALKVSVVPQNQAKGSKKTTQAKPLNQPLQAHKNKKPSVQSPSSSLFAQMLLQSQQQSPTHQTVASKPQKHSPAASSPSQRKTQLIQSQRTLITQNQIKTQNPAPSHQVQNQLREALMIKSDQKTTRDIQKIAEDQNLNLSKLEVSSRKTKNLKNAKNLKDAKNIKKTLQREKSSPIAQKNPDQTKTLTKEHQKHSTQTSSAKEALKSDPIQNPVLDTNQTQASATPQNSQLAKDSALASLLSIKEKEEKLAPQDKAEEKKAEKNQDLILGEAKKETQFKIAQSRETLSHFSQRLKEEIANYKPPFTRLSMELNPQELGKLEITITKKGKELQVSVNANNPNALQAFIQNQNEFKNTLSNIGFNAVELNFSQSDSQQQKEKREEQNQKGNKNSFEEPKEIPLVASMEIKMVQYA